MKNNEQNCFCSDVALNNSQMLLFCIAILILCRLNKQTILVFIFHQRTQRIVDLVYPFLQTFLFLWVIFLLSSWHETQPLLMFFQLCAFCRLEGVLVERPYGLSFLSKIKYAVNLFCGQKHVPCPLFLGSVQQCYHICPM